jgi:hypothetical protein
MRCIQRLPRSAVLIGARSGRRTPSIQAPRYTASTRRPFTISTTARRDFNDSNEPKDGKNSKSGQISTFADRLDVPRDDETLPESKQTPKHQVEESVRAPDVKDLFSLKGRSSVGTRVKKDSKMGKVWLTNKTFCLKYPVQLED